MTIFSVSIASFVVAFGIGFGPTDRPFFYIHMKQSQRKKRNSIFCSCSINEWNAIVKHLPRWCVHLHHRPCRRSTHSHRQCAVRVMPVMSDEPPMDLRQMMPCCGQPSARVLTFSWLSNAKVVTNSRFRCLRLHRRLANWPHSSRLPYACCPDFAVSMSLFDVDCAHEWWIWSHWVHLLAKAPTFVSAKGKRILFGRFDGRTLGIYLWRKGLIFFISAGLVGPILTTIQCLSGRLDRISFIWIGRGDVQLTFEWCGCWWWAIQGFDQGHGHIARRNVLAVCFLQHLLRRPEVRLSRWVLLHGANLQKCSEWCTTNGTVIGLVSQRVSTRIAQAQMSAWKN